MNSEDILTRKINELFPATSEREAALSLLASYGTEKHEKEAIRVRLAILKLSGSDLEKLERNTHDAKQDYRDVLSWAEYPRQSKYWSLPEGIKKQKLRDQDRADYEKWLLE